MTQSATDLRGTDERAAAIPPRGSVEYRVIEILNNAQTALAISMGVRTGLFEALAGGPGTSAEIAQRANLHERYVREWLLTMASVDLVGYEADGARFTLPAESVPFFTPAGGGHNWGRLFPMISAQGMLEPKVAECFRTGAGLPPTEYEGPLEESMAAETSTAFQEALLHQILPEFDLVDRLEAGCHLVDLGCGYGLALRLLAEAFPRSTFTGYDVSRTAVAKARELTAAQGLPNLTFEVRDMEPPSLPDRYDVVMACNSVHDLADPVRFFRDIQRFLRPGGVFLMHEIDASTVPEENFDNPHIPGILTFSLLHCLPLSRHKDGIAPGGLWGRQAAVAALDEAGFTDVRVFKAPADPLNVAFLARVAA